MKDSAFRNQPRRTFLSVGGERFSYLHGRYIRNETLRVSDLMSLRGTAARGTISGRRPPVRVPWPYGITVQLAPESKFDLASHVLARSLFVQPNPCTEQCSTHRRSRAGLRRHFRRALGVGRVSVCQKPFVPPRADIEAIISVNSKTLLPNSSLLTPNSSLYQPLAPNH